MKLEIAERFRPFSHAPGIPAVLPGSNLRVDLFPCLIRLYELERAAPILLAEVKLRLVGPVEQFTVCQDLERGRVAVSGKSAEGWVRYFLIGAPQGGVRLEIERTPNGGLEVSIGEEVRVFKAGEAADLHPSVLFQPWEMPSCERLFLGSSKAQEIEQIGRRLQLTEIFPLWHRLGQLAPLEAVERFAGGTGLLLEACRRNRKEGRPEEGQRLWLNLFQAGFIGLFVPQLEDGRYQGLSDPCPPEAEAVPPLLLLSEGARLIRQMFLQERGEVIEVLPFLLPCFPSGRLLGVGLSGGLRISLEWTKKKIRRLVLEADEARECSLSFRSNVKSCRLRRSCRDPGERVKTCLSLSLQPHSSYLFDNFG